MQESISHAGFVDISGFRVWDVEGLVETVSVGSIFEGEMKRNEIVHETKTEFLDIFSVSLSFYKLFPRFKKILKQDDIIKYMNSFFEDPPPQGFAQCARKD